MDLRTIAKKQSNECSADELLSWRKTQFLINRLKPGDRVIAQFGRPLLEFWLAEVLEEGYHFDSIPRDDFNHILSVRPLAKKSIPINASFVTGFLKHDISKRGNYYEIYNSESIEALDRICKDQLWNSPKIDEQRKATDDFIDVEFLLVKETAKLINKHWPSKAFESFCEQLLSRLPGIEVISRKDSGKGWDLTLRILDPITGEVLFDEVPAQCKNFTDVVLTEAPIRDLERCVRNSESSIAYLFILGNLSDQFLQALELSQSQLGEELGRDITYRLVDQEAIARRYLKLTD